MCCVYVNILNCRSIKSVTFYLCLSPLFTWFRPEKQQQQQSQHVCVCVFICTLHSNHGFYFLWHVEPDGSMSKQYTHNMCINWILKFIRYENGTDTHTSLSHHFYKLQFGKFLGLSGIVISSTADDDYNDSPIFSIGKIWDFQVNMVIEFKMKTRIRSNEKYNGQVDFSPKVFVIIQINSIVHTLQSLAERSRFGAFKCHKT